LSDLGAKLKKEDVLDKAGDIWLNSSNIRLAIITGKALDLHI
jgi:hypothetical protein